MEFLDGQKTAASLGFQRWLTICGLACTLALVPVPSIFSAGKEIENGPQLRVVSPSKGYILGALGERKLIMALEITLHDAGLVTTEFGAVRFVEPNKNTRLFSDNIVAKTEYTDKLGHTIVQVVAVIPVAKLELANFTVTPPFAFDAVRPKEGESKISVPPEAMVEAAEFHFQVQDVTGARSPADQGKTIIGLAQEIWHPGVPGSVP
ncbi:MAG TPA: hypothetical protein VGQ67_08515 [Candidatus Polarisedimenticolia bacterium]|jgi:hypothetical protein|nr:hypothetical protein [Candidatus Polarisedimenticolia bacterium]